MSEEIKAQLDQLADLQIGMDAIRLRKQEAIDAIITPEIKKNLALLDEQFKNETDTLQSRINVLDLDIRTAVKKLGTSIKGSKLHAVWNKGRVTWNTKTLDGYAAGHPEIAQFRTEGEPTISIRPVVAQKELVK